MRKSWKPTKKNNFPWIALLSVFLFLDRQTFCSAFPNTVFLLQQFLDSPFFSPTSGMDEMAFATAAAVIFETPPTMANGNATQPFGILPRWNEATTDPLAAAFLQDSYIYENSNKRPFPRSIALTPDEQQLFAWIQQAKDLYAPKRTTIRIAGGWVRDKLLSASLEDPSSSSLDSSTTTTSSTDFHDIDLVLDTCSGQEFCSYLERYLKDQNVPGVSAPIRKSDDPSNPLQTASLNVGDFQLDFAKLRQETYNSNSRVPSSIGEASVVEDAWRRDLTINSLFYNLNSNQVEDWTEQGLSDLQCGSIATPLPPLPTLQEDPLRILRAIRFAAQLSFRMNRNLVQAARHPKVRLALDQKVSNDRIGKELDGIFRSKDPTRGIQLLMATNLWDSIAPLQTRLSPAVECLTSLARVQSMVSRLELDDWDAERRRFLWYAALFPLPSDTTAHTTNKDKQTQTRRQRRESCLVYQVLTKGLQRPAVDSQAVECILEGARRVQQHLREKPHDDAADLRWKYYQILKPIGPLWREALMLGIARDATEWSDETKSSTMPPLSSLDPGSVSKAVDTYKMWMGILVGDLKLDALLDQPVAPTFNGKQLAEFLPGLQRDTFRTVFQAQEEWQVRNFATETLSANGVSDERRFHALRDYLKNAFPELL